MTCFVDTSAILAILDVSDPRHSAAHDELTRMRDESATLLTTNYIVLEASAVIQRRLGMEAVRTLVADLLGVVTVHWIDEVVHTAAMGHYLSEGRRRLSLVDCTSFEVMRRLGIDHAFAFDPHFAEQGFACRPSEV